MNASPTPEQLAANRANAQKSTGPRNTDSTRYNAVKHGFLAQGLTELDSRAEFRALVRQFEQEYEPVGPTERALVHDLAIHRVRIKRARLLEAEAVTALLNPPETVDHPALYRTTAEYRADNGWKEVIDPGLPARFWPYQMEELNRAFVRYEVTHENRFFRCLHELERRQRARRGEKVAAPAVVDVQFSMPGANLVSFGTKPITPVEGTAVLGGVVPGQ